MEKINTPLMILIEELDSKIGTRKYVSELVSIKKRAIELQQTERDMIEKVHNDSIVDFISELGMDAETEPQRAKDYFTQTFKSYE